MIPLPDLAYAYDALQPVISEATLRLHHGGHHAKYVRMVNELTNAEPHPTSLEEIIRNAALAGERKLFNNAAQAWNHAFFWRSMTARHGTPRGALAHAIQAQYGGLDGLRAAFLAAGTAHFGSGWAWLAAEGDRLTVFSTHDADTVVTRDVRPLLVCDLWEHAYYLDHRNDRAGFLADWWDRLTNWGFAHEQFTADCAWRHPAALEAHVEAIEDEPGFLRALNEASRFLDNPPASDSIDHWRFRQLLGRIADYCDAGDASRTITTDFDSRLREAVRRAAEAKSGEDTAPWAPMVGGDLRRDRAEHSHG